MHSPVFPSAAVSCTPPEMQRDSTELIRWFLRQASDSGTGGTAFDMHTTAQCLLPLTGWNKMELHTNLRKALRQENNLKTLHTQYVRQKKGFYPAYSLTLTDQHGAEIAVTVHPRPVDTKEGTITVVTFSPNVQDNSKVQALSTERNWLRSLLNNLPAFVALIELDGTIRDHNKEFENIFGEVKGKKYQEIFSAHEEIPSSTVPLDIFATSALSVTEWTSHATERSYRNYTYPVADEDGTVLALILGIDITQSRKVQQALELSEQRYRSIADNLTMAIAVIDTTLHISAANKLFRQWFGDITFFGDHTTCSCPQCKTAQHTLPKQSRNIATLIAVALDNDAPPLQSTLQDGDVHTVHFTHRTEDGLRAYKLTTCPIATMEAGVASAIALIEDITETRQVEAKLQRARKLEAMGTLATGIAHEINQPLSALHLYASGLEMLVEKQKELPTETLHTRLSWILREADKIREIVSHMRTLALQEDSPQLRLSSVNEAVQQALGLVGVQLSSHGIDIRLELDKDNPHVLCNAVQLEQVVINLVVNAMHALDTLDIPHKQIIIRSVAESEGKALLEVLDNGPGLCGVEDRIFDPFFTTKDGSTGMGLGLSIVHTFVDSWGGEITVTSGSDIVNKDEHTYQQRYTALKNPPQHAGIPKTCPKQHLAPTKPHPPTSAGVSVQETPKDVSRSLPMTGCCFTIKLRCNTDTQRDNTDS